MNLSTYINPITGTAITEDEAEELIGLNGRRETADRLQLEFSRFVGAQHAVALNSGTAALHLALMAHGVGAGDGVVVGGLCPPAVLGAIGFTGAHPVFVDVNPYTFTIDPLLVEKVVGGNAAGLAHIGRPDSRISAILAVHLFGQPCDMRALNEIAARHHLPVIQVAWDALGATIDGKPMGEYGTAVYSFEAGMMIDTDQGGILTTNLPAIADRVSLLANYGCDVHGRLVGCGCNCHMPVAIAEATLKRLDSINTRIELRQIRAEELTHGLTGIPGLLAPTTLPGAQHAFLQYAIRVTGQFTFSPAQVCRELQDREIRAFNEHSLLSREHKVVGQELYQAAPTPQADMVAKELVFLPMEAFMPGDEIRRIARTLNLMATNVLED